jgi:hypothetical protein
MMTLELTPIESELLRETLDAYRQTLVAEIARADSRQYRIFLRDREELVERLLAKCAAPVQLRGESPRSRPTT